MKREFAAHNARPGVKPPTKEERAYATASGLGDTITGAQLTEIRAQLRAGKRATAPAAIKPTLGSTASVETLTEKKLKNRIERLKNENTRLKVELMRK